MSRTFFDLLVSVDKKKFFAMVVRETQVLVVGATSFHCYKGGDVNEEKVEDEVGLYGWRKA